MLALTAAAGFTAIDPVPVGLDARELAIHVRSPGPPPPPEDNILQLEGDVALMLQVAMLQNSVARLDKVGAYEATFIKQERIERTLQDEQVMFLKLKHHPHSVFFRVEKGDVGREILYPISAEDQRMIVKLPRFNFRIPALKLEPESDLPMKESRYNIRLAGIKELARLALEIRPQDLQKGNKVHVVARDDAQFDRRECFSFTTTYASPEQHKEYRKCVIYIDKQLMIPVYCRNFTWPELAPEADLNNLDATTLVEYYAYKNIALDVSMPEDAFQISNAKYKFGGP